MMHIVSDRYDIRVSIIYLCGATLWIVASDIAILYLFSFNIYLLEAINTFKGLGFVIVTTALLYIALSTELQKRANTELELRESEARLRLFIEHAPAALAMLDRDMRYVAVSRRWITDYQLDIENLLGLSHYDVFPEIPDRWKESYRAALQGKILTAEVDEFRRADGSSQWLNWEVHPWYEADRKVGGIVIFSEDITGRKQTEAHIRHQADLIESVSDAIISTDAQFVIKTWNKAAEALYGWQAQEVIDKPLSKVVESDYPKSSREEVLQRFQRDGVWRGEVVQYHRDGTPIDILSSVSLIVDDKGSVLGVVGVNRDIRDRKRDEKALQLYNQRLSILHQIDQDILNARSPQAISDTVLRYIRHLVACDNAFVVLFDRDNTVVTIFRRDGEGEELLPSQMRVPMYDHPALNNLEQGAVVIIPDLRLQEGTSSGFTQRAIETGIFSTLHAPIRVQQTLIGHLTLGSVTPNFFTPEQAEIVQEVANQLAIAFQNSRLVEDIRTNNQRLQALSARLVEAQEAERRNVARELHDEVGQTLTALGLMLDVQARQLEIGAQPLDLAPSQALVRDLTKIIRELSLNLRPSMLDDLGLIPTLSWYFKRYQEQTGISIEFKHSKVEKRFPSTIETTLYRITQESLTNVARHAKVEAVAVQLWATDEAIYVQIADEGVGFDWAVVQKLGMTGGVLGLHERAQLVGGYCEISSSPGEGTIVSVKIPLSPIDGEN